MEVFGSIMFAVLVALCVFFVVCGIQFSRGRWLGLIVKQKSADQIGRSPKKKGDARKIERALKRQEEERLAIGAKLSYVMFAAAFASGLQILSQVLLNLDIQFLAAAMSVLTILAYVGVFVLFFRTVREIQGR